MVTPNIGSICLWIEELWVILCVRNEVWKSQHIPDSWPCMQMMKLRLGLHQETGNISNKQPNLAPKAIRERRTKKSQS